MRLLALVALWLLSGCINSTVTLTLVSERCFHYERGVHCQER